MKRTIKWSLLCAICAALSVLLYTAIDSDWASKTDAGIWLTVAFFALATITILCGFNAIESKDERLQH